MSLKRVKVISRNPDHYMRDTKFDLFGVQRNYDPALHPLQNAREYKLALNATKLQKVFAKPFIGSLSHAESVSALCRNPHELSPLYSGTATGELYNWDLPSKKCSWKVQAHNGEIYCICAAPDGQSIFSVGNDKTIKRWSVSNSDCEFSEEPMDTWLCDTVVTGFSHHYNRDEFVTCGERVLLWDISAKAPKSSFDWSTSGHGHEASVVKIKFNPVEENVFATSDHANNIILYDTRGKELKKLKMTHRINSLEWNPMEAMVLTVASEDYNCYSFDIRMMDVKERIFSIHQGNTSAVTDLSYSPTGKEFCTGGYDRCIRIFSVDVNRCKEVYHTQRMFRVNCVLWSGDDNYIISGSTDHNARIWKARASQKLGSMNRREKMAIDYSEELKCKYSHFPEISRIARHRHLPKPVYNAKLELQTIRDSKRRKLHNLRKHSKPGSVPLESAAEKPVVGLQDDYSQPSGSK